jgi:hypothetical protein
VSSWNTPEERKEHLRQLKERGEAARASMQAIMDRVEARRRAEEERRERRRHLLRRLLPFRRAA